MAWVDLILIACRKTMYFRKKSENMMTIAVEHGLEDEDQRKSRFFFSFFSLCGLHSALWHSVFPYLCLKFQIQSILF